jgi:hypothetical protein
MEYGKYIIKEVRGIEVAILFHPLINHCDIGTKGDSRGETVSAGFFTVGAEPTEDDSRDISVSCWGKSVTLDMKSRGEKDEELVKKILREAY